jgi:nitrate/nitrite transporter NarK
MIGLKRSILPAIAEREFQIAERVAIFSFIIIFGVTKALMNYLEGRLSDRFGCKRVFGVRLVGRHAGSIYANVGSGLELDRQGEHAVRHE